MKIKKFDISNIVKKAKIDLNTLKMIWVFELMYIIFLWFYIFYVYKIDFFSNKLKYLTYWGYISTTIYYIQVNFFNKNEYLTYKGAWMF